MFSFRSYVVSDLNIWSLIHFEFIFECGVRKCSNLILSSTTYWKDCFLHCVFLPCFSLIRHGCVGLFVGSLFHCFIFKIFVYNLFLCWVLVVAWAFLWFRQVGTSLWKRSQASLCWLFCKNVGPQMIFLGTYEIILIMVVKYRMEGNTEYLFANQGSECQGHHLLC